MPIDKCDCECWEREGVPKCNIPMPVKDAKGVPIVGQLPPNPKLRIATSKVHRCSVCRLDRARDGLTAAEEALGDVIPPGHSPRPKVVKEVPKQAPEQAPEQVPEEGEQQQRQQGSKRNLSGIRDYMVPGNTILTVEVQEPFPSKRVKVEASGAEQQGTKRILSDIRGYLVPGNTTLTAEGQESFPLETKTEETYADVICPDVLCDIENELKARALLRIATTTHAALRVVTNELRDPEMRRLRDMSRALHRDVVSLHAQIESPYSWPHALDEAPRMMTWREFAVVRHNLGQEWLDTIQNIEVEAERYWDMDRHSSAEECMYRISQALRAGGFLEDTDFSSDSDDSDEEDA